MLWNLNLNKLPLWSWRRTSAVLSAGPFLQKARVSYKPLEPAKATRTAEHTVRAIATEGISRGLSALCHIQAARVFLFPLSSYKEKINSKSRAQVVDYICGWVSLTLSLRKSLCRRTDEGDFNQFKRWFSKCSPKLAYRIEREGSQVRSVETAVKLCSWNFFFTSVNVTHTEACGK